MGPSSGRWFRRFAALLVALVLAGCGGGSGGANVDGGSGGASPPVLNAPSLTSQPMSQTVTEGQAVSFTVVADGSAPLTYQWRRNGSDLPGASAATYSIASASLADSGASFSVVVSNATGSVTSAVATLTVTPAPVAAAITSAPLSLTVTAGSTATFTVAAVGDAPLSYQWRRNDTDIVGATGSTYTTGATTPSDSGARFSVRVSNAGGSVTSAEAVLTVNPLASVLSGKAWTTGQTLETDDNAVLGSVYDIDDQGRVMVVFPKYDGTRYVVYATRGSPNATGAAPSWSTPAAIDILGTTVVSGGSLVLGNPSLYGIAMSPAGNAVARWLNREPCTASTYNPSGNCYVLYAARYLAASGAWESPVRVIDVPYRSGTSISVQMTINDSGDVAMRVPGWVRAGTAGYTDAVTVVWRPAGSAGFQSRVFSEVSLGSTGLGLDAAGNLLLVGEAGQNSTMDLVAYRGTISAGFGAQQILDTRSAPATLLNFAIGLNGQQVVQWTQNNGTGVTVYAATSATPTDAFTVVDLAPSPKDVLSLSNPTWLTVDDTGTAIWIDSSRHVRRKWSAGTWLAEEPLPSGFIYFPWTCSIARTGDAVCLRGSYPSGQWASYDAASNAMVGPITPAAYLLGTSTGSSANYGVPAVSVSGIAFTTLLAPYDTLPTPASPAGDGRNVTNLWGFFLK